MAYDHMQVYSMFFNMRLILKILFWVGWILYDSQIRACAVLSDINQSIN